MALGALPTPDLGPIIEPIAPVELANSCDPSPKPGVLLFHDFVLKHLGGGDSGITRDCEGKLSEHTEGRAWDWGVLASKPEDRERVDLLLAWLFARDAYGNDMAMWRRVGLMYLIWNGQIWSSRFMEWRPYTGSSPHTDHVHFSFSWPGARAETSFFSWLRGELHEAPPGVVSTRWKNALAALGGGVAGYFGIQWMRRIG